MTTETTEHRALPKIGQWRPASRLREGWQILALRAYDRDGTEEWWTVTQALHFTAPIKVSDLTFDNGVTGGVSASDEYFCRTPAEIKRASAVIR